MFCGFIDRLLQASTPCHCYLPLEMYGYGPVQWIFSISVDPQSLISLVLTCMLLNISIDSPKYIALYCSTSSNLGGIGIYLLILGIQMIRDICLRDNTT